MACDLLDDKTNEEVIMKVALIVGHSEKSQGAVNKKSGVTEFEINSRLANQVYLKLAVLGIDCEVVWRTGSYSELPSQVNKTNADIAISMHCNAFNTKASGCEVLYWNTSKKGRELASDLQYRLVDVLGNEDRGIKPKYDGDRGAKILKETSMPCALMEPVFIDNDDDFALLDSNIRFVSMAVVEAIDNYSMNNLL